MRVERAPFELLCITCNKKSQAPSLGVFIAIILFGHIQETTSYFTRNIEISISMQEIDFQASTSDSDSESDSEIGSVKQKILDDILVLERAISHLEATHVNELSLDYPQRIYDCLLALEIDLTKHDRDGGFVHFGQLVTNFITAFLERLQSETDIINQLDTVMTSSLLVELEVLGTVSDRSTLPPRVSILDKKKNPLAKYILRDALGGFNPLTDRIIVAADEINDDKVRIARKSQSGFEGVGAVLYHELIHRLQLPLWRRIKDIFLGAFPTSAHIFVSLPAIANKLPPEMVAMTFTSIFIEAAFVYNRFMKRGILQEAQAQLAYKDFGYASEKQLVDQDSTEEETVIQALIEDYKYKRYERRVRAAVEKIKQLSILGYSHADIARATYEATWQGDTYPLLDTLIAQAQKKFQYTDQDVRALAKKSALERRKRILQMRVIAGQTIFDQINKQFPGMAFPDS